MGTDPRTGGSAGAVASGPGALRAWRGHLAANSRATLNNIALIWHYTSLQGIAMWTLIRLMPLLMEQA